MAWQQYGSVDQNLPLLVKRISWKYKQLFRFRNDYLEVYQVSSVSFIFSFLHLITGTLIKHFFFLEQIIISYVTKSSHFQFFKSAMQLSLTSSLNRTRHMQRGQQDTRWRHRALTRSLSLRRDF